MIIAISIAAAKGIAGRHVGTYHLEIPEIDAGAPGTIYNLMVVVVHKDDERLVHDLVGRLLTSKEIDAMKGRFARGDGTPV